MQITYKDKVTLQSNPNIPDENKVTAKDMNEIKSVVNSNEEEQQALNMSVQEIAQNVVNNSQEISNIKEEQKTQNDNIQTNSNNISDLQSNKADKSEIPTDLSQLSNENTKFVNETGLENAIFQEKTQRQNADNNLQNQVDTNKTNIQTNATNIATNTQEINTIKAEQTTQNNRLNSLEVDNTTNKSDILTNKQEINNIKTEQTEQNTNISTNATNIESLQEENENLKKIVSQLPQVEGQGTSITLENTIEAPFTKFDEEGNSTQESTKGYQLVSFTNLKTQSQNGVTITNNNDGSITLNGTSTAAVSLQLSDIMSNLVAGIYQYSANASGTKSGNFSIIVYARDKSQSPDIIKSDAADTFSMTSNKNYEMFYLWLYITEGRTFNNYTIKPMFNSGETAQPWEKFTYGASPNPNYEQPIESAGDNENEFDGVIFSKSTDVTFSNGKIVIPKYTNNTQFITFDTNSYLKNTPYTVSFKAKSTVDGALIRFDGQPDSATTASNLFPDYGCTVNKEEQQFSITGQMTEDFEGLRFFRINSFAQANTSEIEIYDIKIEKGNKASGYSPYGMGSITERIVNGNYFNIADGTYIANNNEGSITFENGIGKVTIASGTSSSFGIRIPLIQPAVLTANQSYTRCNNSGKVYPYVALYDSEAKTMDSMTASDNGIKVYTPTENKEVFYIYLWFSIQSYGDIKPMMTKGSYTLSTMPDFVVGKGQTYTIPVQQPMRSIGDVRDLFFKNVKGSKYYNKDLEENKWYERHYKRLIFDGTENWQFSTGSGVAGIYMLNPPIDDMVQGNFLDGLSNYFHNDKSGKGKNSIRFGANNNVIYIYVDSNEFPDKTSFTSWLAEKYASGHPLYIDYISAEPLDLPCTETQIQQLENLPSTYKDFTIIQSQDETPTYLEVSGIRDIDTMFNKVTNAIVSLGGNV